VGQDTFDTNAAGSGLDELNWATAVAASCGPDRYFLGSRLLFVVKCA
jgi:hypothetical protein